jgi:hypothetical protein
MFLARIVKELGPSNLMTGFISAIPYVLGAVGMIVRECLADRMSERRRAGLLTCRHEPHGEIDARWQPDGVAHAKYIGSN